MRQIGLFVLVGVLFLLQVSFLAALRPFGVVPDVAIIVVILVGLGSTVSQALVVGLVGGILLDIASGADFGLRTGLFVIAALTTGVVRRAGLTLGGPVVALALVAVATIVQTGVILANVLGGVSGWPVGFVLQTLGVELMVNLGLTILLRPLFGWLTPKEAALPTIE